MCFVTLTHVLDLDLSFMCKLFCRQVWRTENGEWRVEDWQTQGKRAGRQGNNQAEGVMWVIPGKGDSVATVSIWYYSAAIWW